MGKASMRRKKGRQDYLGRLARENPEKFQTEWSKRLESWSKEAGRRAGHLTDRNGDPTPLAFMLIDEALMELMECGEEAVALEYEETMKVMKDCCCRAVSRVADRRLYHLSNARSNLSAISEGTLRPPK